MLHDQQHNWHAVLEWQCLYSLWPRDAIWWHRSASALVQVMACCRTTPSHYLSACWFLIREVMCHSSGSNFMSADATILYDDFENDTLKITAISPTTGWVYKAYWLGINPIYAELLSTNTNIHLHFILYLYNKMVQALEMYAQYRQALIYLTWSISWLLMTRWQKEPRHQQPWYWPSLHRIFSFPHQKH